jgi:tetratricopeptide (TPR) repeat protein
LTEYDQAARAAQEILRGDPDNLGALYLQVTIAEARHDYGAAVDVLQRLLGRNRRAESVEETRGRDRVFLVHLGFDLRQLGRFAESAETFARARDVVEPPEAELLGYHVDALVLAGERERALTEARAARGRFPEDAALATQEAHILRELGRPAEAERIVAGLLRRTTSDPETLREVAEFHQRGREFAEAEGLLRELARVRSGDARVLFMLGAVQERQKKHAEAEASFREALGRDPQFAPALNYLGYMFADRGEKLPEALDLLHRAIALDPENGAYLDSLGWALFRSNRAEEAEGYLRRAVAKERESAVVFDHLGDVLKVRGKLLEAVEYWTRALSARDEEQELDRAAVERKIKESGLGR